MSGGDGKESRGPTGGVNGISGSGGPGSGKGWTTTTDPGGWTVHHYTGGGNRTGSQGNGGRNSNSGAASGSTHLNLSLFPEAQASITAGMSINISVIDGLWGFTFLKSQTVTGAMETALSRLAGLITEAAPLAGRFAGVVVGSLLPTPIAKDDPNYMGPIHDRIVQALLANKIIDIAPEALPLAGIVPVKARIRDIVKDEKQHIAVVRPGKTEPAEQVQVVQAVATPRKDVYQVSLVVGMPPIHIRLSQAQSAVSQPANVIAEVKDDAPASVIPAGGNNTHDAVVHFPPEAQQEPIYISVIDVIPASGLKQLNELAEKQKTEWALASQLDLFKAALPHIQSPDYKLPDLKDDENALLRQDRYAAQQVQITLFEIIHARAAAEALETEAVIAQAKGEANKAARLLQQVTELRNGIPAKVTQLSVLREEAAKINAQYKVMYQAATERFFQQRREANQKAVEAYRQQQKEKLENFLKEAMATANIKSAGQLKQEVEAALQAVTVSLSDRQELEIRELLDAIDINIAKFAVPKAEITLPQIVVSLPEIAIPQIAISKPEITLPQIIAPAPKITIPSFKSPPPPPSFMPQKSLTERQAWAQTQLAKPGTVVLRGFSSAESPGRSPLSFAGHVTGTVTFAGEGADSLWRRAAEVRRILQQTSHPLPVVAMLTAINMAESDISTVMLAGAVLDLPSEAELRQTDDTIELSLTARLVPQENQLGVALVRHPQPVAVPVLQMSIWPDTATGFYRYDLTDDAGVRVPVFITPDKAPGTEPLSPEVPEIPETIIHTGNQSGSQPAVIIETLPPAWDTGYRELILIPPASSGLQPIYLMFNDPRSLPGEVTGLGQEVSGNWLDPASREQGAPVPAQIADKLRWRTFSSFDSFRKAFWTEVGNDPELSKQFIQANQKRMNQGLAPRASDKDTVRGRRSFELHHDKPISQDGAVYDLDNLRVTTPKRHIDIHRGKQ